MILSKAIEAWMEHYEEIDGGYRDAVETRRMLAIPTQKAERIVKYLMVPESEDDGPRDHMNFSPEDYQEMLKPITDPVEAGKIVHDWILDMNQALIKSDNGKISSDENGR